ncbi:MAG: tRNA preQ1(34) S-adenosylmethionine ribosyltransferase-isomerase QueA [Gammaproteobacteria bacterium]|nr:MAG: tRNA preQ1(34) S-adenosylmethionine ribosyltransferase-isomerase QueA [Gammaproteobacteria bacterium]
MYLSDFQYELPQELIAQEPLSERAASRLLTLHAQGGREDRRFRELPELLRENDLLVFNDTRVIPARLYGRKESGGRVELLIERVHEGRTALALVRASKSPKPGSLLLLEGGAQAEVIDREGDAFRLRLAGDEDWWSVMERWGHMPLPPYIQRADRVVDRERYQTVYARNPGAVAAPTAGLHFDEPLLERIRERGVETARVTLHVGAGTFQPVRCDRIEEHRMHSEWYEVPEETAEAVACHRSCGGRIVAVGTTSLRALESAATGGGELVAGWGETTLFIYPGYRFRVVDALVTNFHLPGSTLLMLVCAFSGRERVLEAYRHAVQAGYRFFSYGDAMFLERREADGAI